MIDLVIRSAKQEEWHDAMLLAWRTFLKFDYPDYGEEGKQSFLEFISGNAVYRMFLAGSYELFLAFDGDNLIGMSSLRNVSHISLFFVDEKYQGLGVGRALLDYMCNYVSNEAGGLKLTVMAAPYAYGFYHQTGFIDIGLEQESSGMIFTPMEKYIF